MCTDLMPVHSFPCELVLALQSHRQTSVPLLLKPAIEFCAVDGFLDPVNGPLDFITPFCRFEQSQPSTSPIDCVLHTYHLRAVSGSPKNESRLCRGIRLTARVDCEDTPFCVLHLPHYGPALRRMHGNEIARVIHVPKLPGIDINQELLAFPLNDRQQPCILSCHLHYLRAAPL
jgi:hypothetical protein